MELSNVLLCTFEILFSNPGISWAKYFKWLIVFRSFHTIFLRYAPYAIPHMINKWLTNRFCSHRIQLMTSTHSVKPPQQVYYLAFDFATIFGKFPSIIIISIIQIPISHILSMPWALLNANYKNSKNSDNVYVQ